MLSPNYETEIVVPPDCTNSIEDEYIDDIKPDLISLTLSDSNCSHFNSDNWNSPETDCDNSSFHINEGSPDSFLVILESPSTENSVCLSTELLAQGSDVQPLQKIVSSPKDTDRSETKKEHVKTVSSSLEHVNCEQRFHPKNFQFPVSHNKKVSLSLHDVSRLPDFPLKRKPRDFSSDTFQSQSMTTVSSGLKSKDSGLTRSVSVLSLKSVGKSYEHVQSKVKQYISQIKEENKRRENLKFSNISSTNTISGDLVVDENNQSESGKSLTSVIRDLHYELEDRERILLNLQDNYDKLLIKYAEAENKIDQLRFKILDPTLKVNNSKDDKLKDEHYDLFLQASIVLNGLEKDGFEHIETRERESNSKGLQLGINDSFLRTSNLSSPKFASSETTVNFCNGADSKGGLNPLLKPYSSSLRLNKIIDPLSQATAIESYETKNFEFSSCGTFEGKDNLDPRVSKNSDSYSNIVTYFDKRHSDFSITDNLKESSFLTPEEPEEIVDKLSVSEPNNCLNILTINKEVPRNDFDVRESLTCDKAVKSNESNLPHDTSILKVSKWQESLPPLELIEPSCYGSLDCHSSGSKTPNHHIVKKFASSGGQDSGCPASELYNNSAQLNSTKYSKPKMVVTDPKVVLNKEVVKIAQPLCDKTSKISPVNNSVSMIMHKTADKNQQNSQNFNLLNPVNGVDNFIPKSFSNGNVGTLKPLSIDSCECWRLSGQYSDNTVTSISPQADNHQKQICQDFHVPPLQLGSLLHENDSGNSNNDTDLTSTYSSRISSASDKESDHSYYTNYCDDGMSTTHEDRAKSITSPSGLCTTQDSSSDKPLNQSDIPPELIPSLLNVSSVNVQQNSWHHKSISLNHVVGSVRKCHYMGNNNYMNHLSNQSDSLQGLTTSSTSYRSIKLQRNIDSISDKHSNEKRNHDFSSQQTFRQRELNMSGEKLKGSPLRCHLLEFLSNLRCYNSSCVCNKCIQQKHKCCSGEKTDLPGKSLLSCTVIDKNHDSKSVHETYSAVNEERHNYQAVPTGDSTCSRTSHAESTTAEQQISEEGKYNLMKCLDEMDVCAQQLKARSKSILNVLAVQMKLSS